MVAPAWAVRPSCWIDDEVAIFNFVVDEKVLPGRNSCCLSRRQHVDLRVLCKDHHRLNDLVMRKYLLMEKFGVDLRDNMSIFGVVYKDRQCLNSPQVSPSESTL